MIKVVLYDVGINHVQNLSQLLSVETIKTIKITLC